MVINYHSKLFNSNPRIRHSLRILDRRKPHICTSAKRSTSLASHTPSPHAPQQPPYIHQAQQVVSFLCAWETLLPCGLFNTYSPKRR